MQRGVKTNRGLETGVPDIACKSYKSGWNRELPLAPRSFEGRFFLFYQKERETKGKRHGGGKQTIVPAAAGQSAFLCFFLFT